MFKIVVSVTLLLIGTMMMLVEPFEFILSVVSKIDPSYLSLLYTCKSY